MRVLNYGVTVLARLAWYFLALADAHILNETAFEVLLEEFPDLFGDRGSLGGDHWGDPN
jgi:hypothetical protein